VFVLTFVFASNRSRKNNSWQSFCDSFSMQNVLTSRLVSSGLNNINYFTGFFLYFCDVMFHLHGNIWEVELKKKK
jgi:hypothetical protein